MNQNPKLTVGEKIGYAMASTGDSIYYTIIGTFLLFFFTTVAGIDPTTAGILTGIGSVWNAIFNPFMGYIADRTRSKYGKRRPLILGFSIPLSLVAILLFTNFSVPTSIKPIIYGALIILYRSLFTGFYVPYMALGVSYTSDYQDRTTLRLFASLFNMIGNIFSMFLPTMLVNFLIESGITVTHAWTLTAGILAGISLVTTIVTFITSKEKDPPCSHEDEDPVPKFSMISLMKEYASIVKLRPMLYLIALTMSALIGYSILMADMMYFYTYNMEFSSEKISFLLVLRPILGSLMLPLIAKLIVHIDKKWTIILYLALAVVLLTILRLTGVRDGALMVIYIVALMFGTYNYWQIVPSMYYDVCEYDKITNGRDRQATILSFQGMLESVAAGLGTFILGLILGRAGFNGQLDVQSESALNWIFNCTTLVPSIVFIIAIVVMLGYPLTRERYNKMVRENSGSLNDHE